MIACVCAESSRVNEIARVVRMVSMERARVIETACAKIFACEPARVTKTGAHVGAAPLPFVSFECVGDGLEIVRGGFGGRPAYLRRERDLTLASTDFSWVVSASRALGLAVTLDVEALAASCVHLAESAMLTRTPAREIFALPPGTRVRIDPRRYESSALELPRVSESPGKTSVECVREKLHSVVAYALEADLESRVGVLTGGGLDSSALLAIAHAKVAHANAFAIDFASSGDDRPHLATLARELAIHPHRESPFAATFPANLTAAGLPLTWPSGAIEALLLTRAREWGAHRVLSGAGADGWFDVRAASANASLRARLGRVVPWRAKSFFRRVLRSPNMRFPTWMGPTLTRVVNDACDDSLEKKRQIATSPEALEDSVERIRAAFFSPRLARVSELRLQEERLANVLRIDPYLDAELATTVLALPREELTRFGESRGFFREVLRDVVPDSTRLRPDKASFAPVHRALFREPLLSQLRPYASVVALADLGIVSPHAFRRAFDAAVNDDEFAAREAGALYAALALEAFVRAWK